MDLLPQGQRGYPCMRAAIGMSMSPRLGMVDFRPFACLNTGSQRTTCGLTTHFVTSSTWTRMSA
eukprot:508876-Pleurochrysis_carterae.AAC.1